MTFVRADHFDEPFASMGEDTKSVIREWVETGWFGRERRVLAVAPPIEPLAVTMADLDLPTVADLRPPILLHRSRYRFSENYYCWVGVAFDNLLYVSGEVRRW